MAKRFSQDTTMLSTFDEKFDSKNLVFSDPIMNEIVQGNQKIKNYRIYIGTKNPDSTTGNLMVATEELFSFGVSENKNDKGDLTGYTMPVSLWNKTEPEAVVAPKKLWLTKFQDVCDAVADHLVKKDVKRKIGKTDLEKSDLRKLGGIYWRKDKETQELLKDDGPTIYLKIKYFAANAKTKRAAKVITIFVNKKTDETIPILELMGKRMNVTSVIDIESVYIGAKITLQIKVHEAIIDPVDQQQKRFLTKRASMLSGVSTSSAVNPMMNNKSPQPTETNEEEDEEEDVSVKQPSPPQQASPSPPAKTVKPKRTKVRME